MRKLRDGIPGMEMRSLFLLLADALQRLALSAGKRVSNSRTQIRQLSLALFVKGYVKCICMLINNLRFRGDVSVEPPPVH